MNSVPNYLVLPSRCYTASNCEDKLPIKCFFEELEHLVPLLVVWKIPCSVRPWEVDVPSFARVHTVIDNDGANIRVPIATHQLVDDPGHRPWGLVTSHLSVDGGANRAFNPVLLSLETVKARLMEKVGTRKAYDVFV